MLPAIIDPLLRRVFADNPWARSRLTRHQGKRVLIDAGTLRLQLVVSAEHGLQNDVATAPTPDDLQVSLAAAALPELLVDRAAALRAARIVGPADFAEDMSFVLRHLRLDAAGMLAPLTGDIVAHRLASLLGFASQRCADSSRRLSDNVTEYLQYESALLPRKAAIADFRDEIALLTQSLTRIERRLDAQTDGLISEAGRRLARS